MPIYVEMVKDKKTGKMIEKKVGPEKKKQYYIRTYVTDDLGNRKQVTKHNKDWLGLEGRNKAQQEENILKNKIYNQYEQMTLNELCDNYENYIMTYVKLSTLKRTKDNIKLYILPFFKNTLINNITTSKIIKWHDFLSDKNLSTRFKQEIHGTLVSILNHGCKYYCLEKNVASLAGNFKNISSEKKEMNFLTIEEFNSFIQYEENEIYKCFFTILFYSGMRKGELWCLKWDDIDWDNNTIEISKSYNPRNEQITTPKTKKSNRKIQMLKYTINSLNTMKKYITNEFVFGIDKITGTTLQRKCSINCSKANINKNIRIHDFRHSFASMCINNNISIQIISNYLGHENISTTLDIYSHLYPTSQLELVSKLNNLDGKQDQKQDQKK